MTQCHSEIQKKQEVQKKHHDKHTKVKDFSVSEAVWVRDYRGQDKWTKGVIKERTGPLSYRVQVQSELWKRHAEQLRHQQEINDSEVSTDTPELVQVPSPKLEQRTTECVAQR